MDVVLYMRYSSDRQTEQSIEGQQRVCTEFCKAQGYNIVGKYIDRATSAFKDTSKRVSFNKMIKDSDRQQWQAVVVYKLDRFARNRYDSATYKARLKKNGVKVISATENISDNPEGIILEAVLEGMAEFYSKELSQKINRGMTETAYKGNSCGGQIPLGYKVVNKKLVIDEPNAEIVKEAFARYANGESVADICEEYNNRGYRTTRGSLFNKNSFKTMFRNEKYIGIYRYKDIRIEGGVPAIVDKDTFEVVQKRLVANAKAPARGKAKVDYLLAQKMYCGHCGALMVGESGTSSTGQTYNYYSCGSRKRGHGCSKKPLKKDYIERLVAEDAMEFLTPETIELLADMAVEQNRADIANDELIPALKEEIRDVSQRMNNLLKLAESGIQSETVAERIADLEKLKRDTEHRLAEAQGQYIVLEREHIVWWLSTFLNGDINDFEFRKRLLDMLVDKVVVWDDPDGLKITTTYNLIDGNKERVSKTRNNQAFEYKTELSTKRVLSELFFSNGFFGYTRKHRQG